MLSPTLPLLGNASAGPSVAGGAEVASLAPGDLTGFSSYPERVQHLLTRALQLTRQGLDYRYGSDDPRNGGMDCSGTVYYLLTGAGWPEAPRDSAELYLWLQGKGRLHSALEGDAESWQLHHLQPGDLLFWTGTYAIKRDPPITHVMIYAGISGLTGRRVMVGASDGRAFNGVPRYGVSVFDFTPPAPSEGAVKIGEKGSHFVGYGSIPGLNDAESTSDPTGRAGEKESLPAP